MAFLYRKGHRKARTMVSQFENDCLSPPQRPAPRAVAVAGKSPSIPLWQRGKRASAGGVCVRSVLLEERSSERHATRLTPALSKSGVRAIVPTMLECESHTR